MLDAIAWRFIVFAIIFAGLLYLQFYLAHRQWKKIKGKQTSEIDVGYVRMEDYLAQSFRRKVKEWLQLPSTPAGDRERTILKGSEKIRVITGGIEFKDREVCDDILVVEGDFTCGSGCLFAREILVKGNARFGAGAQLQSVAVDGNLTLGADARVSRWLDSSRELSIGADCLVGARVTSLGPIRLGPGAQAASMYAPQVTTTGWDGRFLSIETPEMSALPAIVFSKENTEAARESMEAAGFDMKRLLELGSDSWMYKGDLRLIAAVRLRTKLVVKGNCHLPEGSVLETDIHADGSLEVGANSLCRGNLIAGRDIHLGPKCQFSGLIHADGSVQLGRGTRGFKDDGMVVAFAGEVLQVERDVAIKGKLAAGGRVIIESAEAAEAGAGKAS
jgi:predicted acyltransferase (DUF342 family)